MSNKMNDGDVEGFVIGVMLRLEVGLPYWCFSPDYAIPLSLVAVLLSVATERAYRRMTSTLRRVLFMAAGGLVQTAIPVGLLIATTRYRYPDSAGSFDWPKFKFLVLYGSLGCLAVAAMRVLVIGLIHLLQAVERLLARRRGSRDNGGEGGGQGAAAQP